MDKFTKIIIIFFLIIFIPSSSFATSFRRDCFLIYTGGGSERARQDSLIAYRSDLGFDGWTSDYNIIRDINPDFKWFSYISVLDGYTSLISLDEHEYVSNRALQDGLDPEVNYLHYWDDTYVKIEGQTLFIPGYGGGSANTLEEARIPVYFANKSRTMKNYSNADSRKYHVEYVAEKLSELPSGSNVGYRSGIVFDNSAYILWNYGTIQSGGHVLEHPSHANIDDIGTSNTSWYWNNLRTFLTEVMDTLETSAQWSPDGKKKLIGINIANSWTDDYIDFDVANYLIKEFIYSATRNLNYEFVKSHRDDSLAFLNGKNIVYMAKPYKSLSGYEGSYTYGEALVGNLCWFYLVNTDSSYFFQQGKNAPGYPEWDTLVWCDAMDYNVGYPLESHYQLETNGVDGRGYSYNIYSREYKNAKIYLRPRGQWNEHIDQSTSVSFNLGGSYRELRSDGTLGPIVTSISFRNGQGRMMTPAQPSNDNTPPSPTTVSASTGLSYGSIDIFWKATGDDGNVGTASYYVIKYSTSNITSSNWNSITDSVDNPPYPGPPGTNQNMTIYNLIPDQNYYIGIKVYDYSNNASSLSNISSATSAGGLAAGGDDTSTVSRLLIPDGGSTIYETMPVLSARNIGLPGQNYYTFEISTDASFNSNVITSSPVLQSNSNFTEWEVTQELEVGTEYFWRVKVNDFDYSDIANFLIGKDIYPYPNPVDFNNGETIKFILPDMLSNLLIINVSGETIVYKKDLLGEWNWNGNNDSGQLIASGVYLWYIEGTDYKGKIINRRQ